MAIGQHILSLGISWFKVMHGFETQQNENVDLECFFNKTLQKGCSFISLTHEPDCDGVASTELNARTL